MFASGMVLVEACTAVLLLAQARQTRLWSDLLLGGAYLFGTGMALLHLLTFPGALLPDSPAIGPPGAVAWLILAWQAGFPALVLAALIAGRHGARLAERRVAMAIAALPALVALACALLAAGVFASFELLPPAFASGSGGRWSGPNVVAAGVAIALGALVQALVWTTDRRHDGTLLWIAVATLAGTASAFLAMLGGGQFALGWYAGRGCLLLSGGILFLVFLARFVAQSRLQARMLTRLEVQAAALRGEVARRQQAEAELRQAQKLEMIGTLTGGIAHDFNNLLTAINGSLELLALDPAGPRAAPLIETARSAGDRAARVTRDLLAFGRRQPLRLGPLDLNDVVRAARPLLAQALGPGITLELALAPDLWSARADPDQTQLGLLNLVVNARDALPDGGTIRVTTANLPAGDAATPGDLARGDHVVLAVADDGAGMPPEILERCLEPFFTSKEVGKGSGLGLPMVHGVAKQSGGTLRVTSAPGCGTTVQIYLPRG